MRPGEQPAGGGPVPSWPNPYQQPGYRQPNPYEGPPSAETPATPYGGTSAYPPAAPPGPPVPGLGPAGGGDDGGDGGGREGGIGRVALGIVTGVAVLSAAVVGGVIVLRDGGGGTPSAGGTPSPGETPGTDGETYSPDGPDDPRRGILRIPDPVVAPDWQVQTSENRHNAFDVPPDDWTIGREGVYVGYEDDRPGAEEAGDPLVAMAAVAIYKEGWCDEAGGASERAMAGSKGGQGATGTAEAAHNEAVNWARAAYDQRELGTLDVSEAEPFESDHGISGHVVRATVTGVPEDPDNPEPCGVTDGKVVAFSYLDLDSNLATWVVVADAGVPDELDDATIDRMLHSLRPYPVEEEQG
ncbi:hypothetical protein [Streptomyces sp. RFCAC02]|uniref:hypothetical protein n=1 Tax=Streptomyces sp. RFCAC02 TaxID=2499143 RepID=UPI00102155DD|nr:hypothetical protein [Streptomyces sp. RFCAC02]